MKFKEIAQKRYAAKRFTGEKIPEDKIDELCEYIRLAPSSFGLQPWKVRVITDDDMKQRLQPHTFNQPQITTCSHLFVFCANTNVGEHIEKYEKMMTESGVEEKTVKAVINRLWGFSSNMDKDSKLKWAQNQIYIALANALNGAKELGFDSCPMGGFLPREFADELELPENLVPTVLCAVGYAADKPRKKIRFPKEDMFF